MTFLTLPYIRGEQASVGAMVYGIRGIDHFGALSLSSPLLPSP